MHVLSRALPIILALSAWGVTGCSTSTEEPAPRSVPEDARTPIPLREGGKFQVCTNAPFEPAVMVEDGELVGYEIDIMDEIATRLHTAATYVQQDFDDLIPTLVSGGCDAIISSMTTTKARRDKVLFVEYLVAGTSGTSDSARDVGTDAPRLGIAVRKQDVHLHEAIQVVVDEMFADGTMPGLLKQWDVDRAALPDVPRADVASES